MSGKEGNFYSPGDRPYGEVQRFQRYPTAEDVGMRALRKPIEPNPVGHSSKGPEVAELVLSRIPGLRGNIDILRTYPAAEAAGDKASELDIAA